MDILYFSFVGKGKSKADVPIMGEKNVSEQHIFRTGGKGSAFIRPGMCEVTAGMQEVGLMWRLINLFYTPAALWTTFKSSADVWGLEFPRIMCEDKRDVCFELRLGVDRQIKDNILNTTGIKGKSAFLIVFVCKIF